MLSCLPCLNAWVCNGSYICRPLFRSFVTQQILFAPDFIAESLEFSFFYNRICQLESNKWCCSRANINWFPSIASAPFTCRVRVILRQIYTSMSQQTFMNKSIVLSNKILYSGKKIAKYFEKSHQTAGRQDEKIYCWSIIKTQRLYLLFSFFYCVIIGLATKYLSYIEQLELLAGRTFPWSNIIAI